MSNRCPNEAVSEWGMCLRHLAGSAGEFEALIADAKAQFPALAAMADDGA